MQKRRMRKYQTQSQGKVQKERIRNKVVSYNAYKLRLWG